MKLAPSEMDWLREMRQAFHGSAWDMRWLREIRYSREGPQRTYSPRRQSAEKIIQAGAQPRMTLEQREAYKRAAMRAAQIVCRAIKAGNLIHPTKLVCTDCKIQMASVYEHRDYAKPLEVDPVCQRCNMRRGPAILSSVVPSSPKKIEAAKNRKYLHAVKTKYSAVCA